MSEKTDSTKHCDVVGRGKFLRRGSDVRSSRVQDVIGDSTDMILLGRDNVMAAQERVLRTNLAMMNTCIRLDKVWQDKVRQDKVKCLVESALKFHFDGDFLSARRQFRIAISMIRPTSRYSAFLQILVERMYAVTLQRSGMIKEAENLRQRNSVRLTVAKTAGGSAQFWTLLNQGTA